MNRRMNEESVSYDQQVLLDTDFDNAPSHWVEDWLGKHREHEETVESY